jgi:hypothetical protein
MTRQMAIQTMALPREQALKIFQMTGPVLSAVLQKKILTKNNFNKTAGQLLKAVRLFCPSQYIS